VQTVLNIKTKGVQVDDVKIFSALGILVKEHGKMRDSAIDVSQLPAGTYFIRIVSGEEIVTKKFIKK